MSKLRASISFQNRIDEVKNIQQKKSKENIAEPIIPIIIDSNEENSINLEDPKVINCIVSLFCRSCIFNFYIK